MGISKINRLPAAALIALLGASIIYSAAKSESLKGSLSTRETLFLEIEDRIKVTGEHHARDTGSATKTPTALIDIPQSLSLVSRAQIDAQALTDIGDILRYTPGASVGQGEGHRDQFTIRGQNTTADFFIDGVRDDVQYFRPLYNLERVEILRGSNALIFGRGGGGGVINRVTKTPEIGANFAEGSVSIDTFGSAYISGDTNIAIGSSAGLRLNGYYESLDNHRDFFGGDRFAVNPTFAADLSNKLSILLSYEYVDDDRTVDRGVPSLNGAPLRNFDETFFGDPDANRTTLQAHIAKARVDYQISSQLSLNTTVQYADYDKVYQNLFPVGFDDVAGTVSLDGYLDTTQRQNFIVQTNLIGEFNTGFLAHTLLVGSEYGNQQTDNDRRDVLFASSNDDQVTFLFSDPLSIPTFSFPVFNRNRNSDAEFLSFYIQDQIDIGEYFKLVAGVRYDRFDIDVVDVIEVNDGIADGNDGFLGRVDEEFSPRIGLIYKPVDNLSFYTSYSRSFLPRSGDQFLTLSPTNEALEPEQFDNYEVGVKWDLSEKFAITASLFRLDRENGLTVDPADVGNTLVIGSRTEGAEVQFIGEIVPGWRVNGGYSYLDAEERGRVSGGVLANRTLSQVPTHMFSLWNRIDVNEKLGVGFGVTQQSAQFASISNNVELPGFVRFDAAVYYQLTSDLEIQLNIENILNADYFSAAHNDNNITTGEPVNARISVRGRF